MAPPLLRAHGLCSLCFHFHCAREQDVVLQVNVLVQVRLEFLQASSGTWKPWESRRISCTASPAESCSIIIKRTGFRTVPNIGGAGRAPFFTAFSSCSM